MMSLSCTPFCTHCRHESQLFEHSCTRCRHDGQLLKPCCMPLRHETGLGRLLSQQHELSARTHTETKSFLQIVPRPSPPEPKFSPPDPHTIGTNPGHWMHSRQERHDA